MQAKISAGQQADDSGHGHSDSPGQIAKAIPTPRRRGARSTEKERADAEAELHRRAEADDEWRRIPCTLATPMYGGGVQAGTTDRAMPIRAASIRGQLRFWWRVIFDNRQDSQAMFEREAALWGGIGREAPRASQVRVRVQCRSAQDSDRRAAPDGPQAKHGYAFGPALIGNARPWLLKADYDFVLQLRYPRECADDVEKTLRWWGSFGGIGARTRRGFGAVLMDDMTPRSAAEDIEAVRQAGGRLCLGSTRHTMADAAWEQAERKLRRFRQQGRGRPDRQPSGRSFWPEADQIRRFSGKNAHHRHDPVHAAKNVFPRAAFGLPITFQFKDRDDPDDHELLPDGSADRMASPLILRPYWNGENWQAAALLLPGWQRALEQPLRFKKRRHAPAHWPEDARRRAELAQLIAPMKTADGALRGDDPLSAFLQFFAEES